MRAQILAVDFKDKKLLIPRIIPKEPTELQ